MLDVVDTPYRGGEKCPHHASIIPGIVLYAVGHFASPNGVSTTSSIILRLCMAYPPQ